MRFPILALIGALAAVPAMATPSYNPEPITQSKVAATEEVQSPVADSVPQNVASDGQAIFSEPTEPVPLMPSQRKLLRVRKA